MKSDRISTRNLRMHYLQSGTGRPVVFLHGFPETSHEWRHQVAALDDRYACFAPDLRGFGATDKPGARVTRDLLARDVVSFLDALGIERAAVVAHDWGGIVASKLALDWPERVERLALLDTLCTVWAPRAVHGYWFKVHGLAEDFFAAHHRAFIESVVTGISEPPLPPRPASPWQGRGQVATWADAEDVDHYARAFADPAAHWHAISYYRYALPFHIVRADPGALHGERYESLDEDRVAAMWLHPGGLEQHPEYSHYMDYGPEDRHKRYGGPVLWMFGTGRAAGPAPGAEAQVPAGNPFVDQFSRYFPDLRVRRVAGGHFFPEELPDVTSDALGEFLAARI